MIASTLPSSFVWRRVHSLTGLWLMLFLFEHLLVNSQAALLWGGRAPGFVHLVNSLHNLPFLHIIEVTLLGVPFAVHIVWGIRRIRTSRTHSWNGNGHEPLLRYERNWAYTLQRYSAWVLIVGVLWHVVDFRWLSYPSTMHVGTKSSYCVTVAADKGLYALSQRLGITLYDADDVARERRELSLRQAEQTLVEVAHTLPTNSSYNKQDQIIVASAQAYEDKKAWVEVLEQQSLAPGEVIAVAPDFGTATLLVVRDEFKNPWSVAGYTLFVLAACFHGLNGLWTFLITWGVILRASAQKLGLKFTWALMGLVALLGLSAIWGTYLSL